jgi:hypothetical protein
MKSFVPVNCPWGLARSCRVAPVHFRPPIGGPVSSLHVRAPLPGPTWPPAVGPVFNELSCHPGELPWGSARSSREAPIHFRRNLRPGFELPHVHMLGPKAAASEAKGVGLPGELVRAQQAVILLTDLRHAAHSSLSLRHVQLNVPGCPHVIMLHT